jgi:hypothetical protein
MCFFENDYYFKNCFLVCKIFFLIFSISKKAVSLYFKIKPTDMTTITIQTDNSHFTKAIVQLCKALGIAKVMTTKTETPSAAAQKKLRPDIATALDKVERGDTTKSMSFATVEDIKQHYGLNE